MLEQRHWDKPPDMYDDGNGNYWWSTEPNPRLVAEGFASPLPEGQPPRLRAAVYGKRSDGEFCFVTIETDIDADDITKRTLAVEAEERLNTTLNCECVYGYPCSPEHAGAVVREGGQMPVPTVIKVKEMVC